MLSKRLKELKLRKKLESSGLKWLIFKYSFIQFSNNKTHLKTGFLPNLKNFSRVRMHRRCVLTNRVKGVQTKYNISRIKLRELLQFGVIPGYKKSV